MDIAELGLAVRSDGVVVASNRLRQMEQSAGKAERATDALAKTLQRAMAIVGATFTVSAFVELTNVWTDLNSRVNIAAGSMEAGSVVMERLSDMARRTYSSLQLTAESYLLNSTALTQMGYATSQQLDLTEALNNALVVSGAKGDRAASVLNAWSKAMAVGKLSGDDLNTVISTGGRVASALAESMGKSVLELRALGSAGKITTKEMYGITSQLEKLRAEADAMPATIGDALGQLSNSVLKTVGMLDEAAGGSSRVAEAILLVADNMDIVVVASTGLATVMLSLLSPALLSAAGAFGALTLALLANPLVQIALLVGALTTVLVYLDQQQRNAAQAAEMHANALDVNANALETAKTSSQTFRNGLRSQIELQIKAAQAALEEAGAQYKAAQVKAKAANLFGDVMKGLSTALYGEGRETNYGGDIMDDAVAGINAAYKRLNDFKSQLGSLSDIEAKYPPGAEITVPGSPDKAAAKAEKAYAKVIESANERIDQSRIEAQALGMTAQQADTLRFANDLLAQAQSGGAKITNDQVMELNGLAASMAAAEQHTRQLAEAYDFGKATFGSFFSDLKSDLMNGTSLWDGFANAGANALNKIADKALSMAADGIFDMIFNAASGFLGGGGFGSLGNDIGKGAGSFANIGSFLKSANGNVFDGSAGLSAYSNRVVSTPTVFAYAKGAGLMGEAGPEAIMPLSRNSRGQLGVQVANNNQPAAANGNARSETVVRLIMPDGWRAEVVNEARSGAMDDTVRIVQANDKALRNYRQNGGN